MAIRVYKPTSPARRFMSVLTFEEVTKKTPERSLVTDLRHKAGRNNQGKITVRHQGGGARRKYRIIDFKRQKDGIPATVKAIEYDPNRTCFIALLVYADGEKRYILSPLGLKVGDTVMSGPTADIKPGNCLPIANIPLGTLVHNIEIKVGRGGQMVRSAGTAAQVMAKEGDRPDPPALRRGSQGEHERPCDRGPGRQHRSQQRPHRQGRPQAPHGRPSHRPRRGHEPGGSPARRRRGPQPRGHARSDVSVGQEDAGRQDPQASQVFGQADHQPSQEEQVRPERRQTK